MEKRLNYISPLAFLWISHLSCYYLPSLYMLAHSEDFFLDLSVEATYRKMNLIYIITLIVFPVLLNLIFYKKLISSKILKKSNLNLESKYSNYKIPIHPKFTLFLNIISWISIVLFFTEGLSKILLLGSDIDNWEYRIMGYDDRNRVLNLLLESIRKIMFPLSIFYVLVSVYIYGDKSKSNYKSFLTLILISYFLISIINLDRGPIFVFFGIISYFFFIKSKTIRERIVVCIVAFIVISFVGGLVTLLQYNITNFPIKELTDQSLNIIFHRIVADPAYASYILSFEVFPEYSTKLYLQYSRIGALFTWNYTQSFGDTSIYVAPAGIVGDIWRNFGEIGMYIFSAIVSGLFWLIDKKVQPIDFTYQTTVSILSIILSMYLLFGGLFSLGPVFLFIIIFVLCSLFGSKQTWTIKF